MNSFLLPQYCKIYGLVEVLTFHISTKRICKLFCWLYIFYLELICESILINYIFFYFIARSEKTKEIRKYRNDIAFDTIDHNCGPSFFRGYVIIGPLVLSRAFRSNIR